MAGILGNQINGPIFFGGSLNGVQYLLILQELVSQLANLFHDPLYANIPNIVYILVLTRIFLCRTPQEGWSLNAIAPWVYQGRLMEVC